MRIFVERLIVSQLVEKLPTVRLLLYSQQPDKLIRSLRCHPFTLSCILVLSSHLRLVLANGLFPSRYPPNSACIFLLYICRVPPLPNPPEYLVSSSNHDAVVVPILSHMNLVYDLTIYI